MDISPNGLNLIKQFESCKLVAYLDSAHIPTIGWGHTREVHMGMTCTQDQADAWLIDDVQSAIQAVNNLVTTLINQNQFDALVSFTFNLGTGNLASSTLLKLVNLGDFTQAAKEFPKWDHVTINGKLFEVTGLLNRRNAEAALFLAPCQPVNTPDTNTTPDTTPPITPDVTNPDPVNQVPISNTFFGFLKNFFRKA